MKLVFDHYEKEIAVKYFEIMRNGWPYRIEYFDDCDDDCGDDEYLDTYCENGYDEEIFGFGNEEVGIMYYKKILTEKNIWGKYIEPYSMIIQRKVMALIHRLYKEYEYDVTDKEINEYFDRLEAADVCE